MSKTTRLLIVGLTLASPMIVRAEGPTDRPAPPLASLLLTINSTRALHMSKKQPIKEVLNEKETVLRVGKGSNERTVLVSGLAIGVSRLTFTATDGSVEIINVIVQQDLDLLKKLLERVAPTAVVTPISAGNSIILTGTVARAEDIDIIIAITQGFVGTQAQVVNALGPRR
jgi:Flp pilus assembly secretin CpaC